MDARSDIAAVVVLALAATALGMLLAGPASPQPGPPLLALQNSTLASLRVPAVDSAGRGVVSSITVQAAPGTGRALANIDNVLFWVDTQSSIRTARAVAENVTGKDLSRYDLVYTVNANASLIEGPSAGAALTIATIAALEHKTPDASVSITGTIEPDGSIGEVGAVPEKAGAAQAAGITLFLVPEGQSVVHGETQRVKECSRGPRELCSVRYVAEERPIAGPMVREVRTIQEALGYFL